MTTVRNDRIRKMEAILLNLDSEDKKRKLITANGSFLRTVTPLEVAWSVQNLIAGMKDYNFAEQRLMNFIEAFGEPLLGISSLPEDHILNKILAEHETISRMIVDLEQVCQEVGDLNFITAVSRPYQRLQQIATWIYASDKHLDVEEQVFFGLLEKNGIWAIPKLLKTQHFELRHHTVQLHELVFSACTMEFNFFRDKLNIISSRLIPLKRKHIAIEESIFYPLLAEIIEDPTVWESFSRRCREIDSRYL